MRITILYRSGGGNLSGGFRILTDYAEALQRSGHEVVMVSPTREEAKFSGPIGRRLPFRKPRPRRADFLEGRSFAVHLLERDRAVTAADVPDADVVIASWWECAEWMSALPLRKGRPVHFMQGYELAPNMPHLPQDRARAVLDRDVARLCVAGWLAEKAKREHGATRVRVVPNGVDTDVFKPGNAERAARVGHLFSGAPAKRSRLAVETAGMSDGYDVVAFGRSRPAEAASFSQFLVGPSQEDIVRLYGDCRAWLFTSESEGFGLPILEAMACGTPVVATAGGAAPDLIDGTNGVLVEPNPEAMAEAARRFATMPEEGWQQASKAARETAQANSLGAAADRFEQALIDVLEDRL